MYYRCIQGTSCTEYRGAEIRRNKEQFEIRPLDRETRHDKQSNAVYISTYYHTLYTRNPGTGRRKQNATKLPSYQPYHSPSPSPPSIPFIIVYWWYGKACNSSTTTITIVISSSGLHQCRASPSIAHALYWYNKQ